MAFDPWRFSKPQKHDLELMRQEKAAAKRARRHAKRQAAADNATAVAQGSLSIADVRLGHLPAGENAIQTNVHVIADT